jgi:hypothetical protein
MGKKWRKRVEGIKGKKGDREGGSVGRHEQLGKGGKKMG